MINQYGRDDKKDKKTSWSRGDKEYVEIHEWDSFVSREFSTKGSVP